jgi:hypothetical protein
MLSSTDTSGRCATAAKRRDGIADHGGDVVRRARAPDRRSRARGGARATAIASTIRRTGVATPEHRLMTRPTACSARASCHRYSAASSAATKSRAVCTFPTRIVGSASPAASDACSRPTSAPTSSVGAMPAPITLNGRATVARTPCSRA